MLDLGDLIRCDVDRLIDTRLLVVANSGGGKSWALRRLLEQSYGKVQHLVIDPEGEFASLREKYDYVVAAPKGGDTAADPRTAALLAERLLELRASAILDIYELRAHERVRFVRLFLDALVDARKALWHPALVILDEAHVYAPQQGEAESAGAVTNLATRGRKRGFCLVPATQRLAKLHKDVAAECNNYLIGRTALDVDMKRASDLLGFTAREDQHRLRTLEAGEFFAFGPAISPTAVVRGRIGPVKTTHPKAGHRLGFEAPPPTAKIKALLPQLADLPAEQEAREKSVADLKRELAEARRELTLAKKAQPAVPKAERVEVPVVAPAVVKRVEQCIARLERVVATWAMQGDSLREQAQAVLGEANTLRLALAKATASPAPVKHGGQSQPLPSFELRNSKPAPASTPILARGGGRTDPQERILASLAWWRSAGVEAPSREQVAFVARYSVNGHFNNVLGGMRTEGLVEYPAGNAIALTAEGHRRAPTLTIEPTRRFMIDQVRATLRQEPLVRIFDVLVQADGGPLSRAELAAGAGYSVNGHFNNCLGRLNTLGVVRYPRPGEVAFGEMFEAFP